MKKFFGVMLALVILFSLAAFVSCSAEDNIISSGSSSFISSASQPPVSSSVPVSSLAPPPSSAIPSSVSLAQPTPATPTLQAGSTTLQQGDIFSVQLLGIAQDIIPTAETQLGMANFLPLGSGAWYCAIPVGNTRAEGEYAVYITAGEDTWQETITVEPFEFDEQNLIIDVTDPVITEANSPEAYQEYREKIPPLFYTYDEEIYWSGTFMPPVEGGWISTEFGSVRYTNSDYSNPRFHWGMDFAVAEGTPIAAPNAGRVVLAEYLLNTGWTIVIEHGGGLKSYYFHMFEINVQPEDIVSQGDIIGKVGTTGYSTGNHLHFEMRIGDQAVSPSMLFENSAGLYSAFNITEEPLEN